MKKILSLLLCMSFIYVAVAQNKTLAYTMTLKMPADKGARGSSVAWHPVLKKYYAPKSGNSEYTMAIFDQKGTLVSPEGLKAMFDTRGFWYDPKLKTFCANGYNTNGWITYELDERGVPTNFKSIVEEKKQPGDQSVGSFDAKNNVVYFFDGQYVTPYDAKTQEPKTSIRLYVNKKNADDESGSEYDTFDEYETPENINSTSVVYTGIPKKEFALLDFTNKEIQFYDKATGYITQKSKLPEDAPAQDMLCFTYANNIFWLFDMETKYWKGYK